MSHHAHTTHVLVLDDHVIIRRGLRNLITLNLPHVTVRDVPTIKDLLVHLKEHPLPEILVLDLQLADGNAMEHLEGILGTYPTLRILVYSMNPERIYAQRVVSMGCAGYLSKEAPEAEVLNAIRKVMDGGTYLSLAIQLQHLDHPTTSDNSPFDRLSKQELLVLDHVLAGLGVKDIGLRMGISMSTAATYKARLFEKLDVVNALELQTLVNVHGYRRS